MENKYVAFESIPKEDHEIASNNTSNGDHGWHKVTYAKRQRKAKPSAATGGDSLANGNSKIANGGDNVFRSLEQQSEDRRRRIVEAQREANGVANGVSHGRSKVRSDDDDESDSEGDEIAAGNGKAEAAKKPKVKKPKKPKVTVSEASAKIDANHLSAFLAEISVRISKFLHLICFVSLISRGIQLQFLSFVFALNNFSFDLGGFWSGIVRIAARIKADAIRRLFRARIHCCELGTVSMDEVISRVNGGEDG